MTEISSELSAVISVRPGEQRVVFRDNGAETGIPNPSLAVFATQEESPDDGGSQSALGVLDIGSERPVRVEFDIKDGAVLSVPVVPFTVSVRNLNEPDQPDLHVQAYYVHGRARGAVDPAVTTELDAILGSDVAAPIRTAALRALARIDADTERSRERAQRAAQDHAEEVRAAALSLLEHQTDRPTTTPLPETGGHHG